MIHTCVPTRTMALVPRSAVCMCAAHDRAQNQSAETHGQLHEWVHVLCGPVSAGVCSALVRVLGMDTPLFRRVLLHDKRATAGTYVPWHCLAWHIGLLQDACGTHLACDAPVMLPCKDVGLRTR